jgi:hypothetical protein
MMGALEIYYSNQLKKRRVVKKIIQERSKLVLRSSLSSQIIQRKSYVINRTIDTLSFRRGKSHINAYNDVICEVRNTKMYIGFPRHILSFLIKDKPMKRRY